MSEKKLTRGSTPAEALAKAFVLEETKKEPEKDVSQGEP